MKSVQDFESEFEGVPGNKIRGPIVLPYLKEAPEYLNNGMIWMESDGLHIYRDNAEVVLDS